MTERLLITFVLVLVGVAAYKLYKSWHVKRVAAHAQSDPLLRNFMQGVPGVVLFTADYCYPCKSQQQPAIRRLIDQVGTDSVQYIQVDVEAYPEVAQRWGVMSLPTTFILDANGTPRDVNHGVTSTDKLKRQLEAISG